MLFGRTWGSTPTRNLFSPVLSPVVRFRCWKRCWFQLLQQVSHSMRSVLLKDNMRGRREDKSPFCWWPCQPNQSICWLNQLYCHIIVLNSFVCLTHPQRSWQRLWKQPPQVVWTRVRCRIYFGWRGQQGAHTNCRTKAADVLDKSLAGRLCKPTEYFGAFATTMRHVVRCGRRTCKLLTSQRLSIQSVAWSATVGT